MQMQRSALQWFFCCWSTLLSDQCRLCSSRAEEEQHIKDPRQGTSGVEDTMLRQGSSKVCTLQLDIGRGWSLSDNTTSGQEILCLIAFKFTLKYSASCFLSVFLLPAFSGFSNSALKYATIAFHSEESVVGIPDSSHISGNSGASSLLFDSLSTYSSRKISKFRG